MNELKQYDLSKSEGFFEAFTTFTFLKEKGSTIEIKEVKPTRTNKQNAALHLFFTWCSDALNNSGVEFSYRGIKGMEIEVPWTGEMFKTFVWKPIQKVLYQIDSTTQLKRSEIDPIFDVICRHFATMGIPITFPSSFNIFLEKC